MIKLIIFDLDGTLVKTHTPNLLPGVADFFHKALKGDGGVNGPAPHLAIATNQGGVGFRYWIEKEHFGIPLFYPTQESVEKRLQSVVRALGGDEHTLPVYVCFAYVNRQGQWSPTPPGKENDPRWQPGWRKPQPGMLLQAIQDHGVNPDETLYVGDRDEDKGAARAAGCHFSDARAFFNAGWKESVGDDLGLR